MRRPAQANQWATLSEGNGLTLIPDVPEGYNSKCPAMRITLTCMGLDKVYFVGGRFGLGYGGGDVEGDDIYSNPIEIKLAPLGPFRTGGD